MLLRGRLFTEQKRMLVLGFSFDALPDQGQRPDSWGGIIVLALMEEDSQKKNQKRPSLLCFDCCPCFRTRKVKNNQAPASADLDWLLAVEMGGKIT